jgi:hypothetical protein
VGDCPDDQGWERDDFHDGYGPIGVVLHRDPRPAPGLPRRRSLGQHRCRRWDAPWSAPWSAPCQFSWPAPGTAGAVTMGLAVDESVEQVVSMLEERGVVFYGPVVDEGQLKLAFFADPDGNGFYLAEPY